MTAALNTQQPLVHVISRRLLFSEVTGVTSIAIPMNGAIPKGSLKTFTRAFLVTPFAPTTGAAIAIGPSTNVSMFMTTAEIGILTAGASLTGGTTGFGVLTADVPLFINYAAPASTALTAGELLVAVEFIAPTMNKEASGLLDTNNS